MNELGQVSSTEAHAIWPLACLYHERELVSVCPQVLDDPGDVWCGTFRPSEGQTKLVHEFVAGHVLPYVCAHENAHKLLSVSDLPRYQAVDRPDEPCPV